MATIETALTRLLGIEHPILLAPQKMGVKPEDCLIIGDTSVDVLPAGSAGAGVGSPAQDAAKRAAARIESGPRFTETSR